MPYERTFRDTSAKSENTKLCVRQVGLWHFYQCARKRGHGPDGLFCKQHAGIVESMEARIEARRERHGKK